jgi:F0F1-type ATP synthase membrane subunit b/b'
MDTLDDIGRLRAAEKEAQDIVAQARDEARRVRSETETRVAELSQGAAAELAAMRERVQSEEQGETDACVRESRARVESMSKDIAGKLKAGKADAVKAVVEALVTL